MPTTKAKPTAKKVPAKKPAVKQPTSKTLAVSRDQLLAILPSLAQQQLGWKPSITRYVFDPKELARYTHDASFNAQTPVNDPGQPLSQVVGGFARGRCLH